MVWVSGIQAPAHRGEVSARAMLPRSSTSMLINLVGVAAFIGAFLFCREWHIIRIEAALLCSLAYAIPVILGEVFLLKSPWSPSTGLDFSRAAFSARRIGTKLLGLYSVFALVAFAYWLFPEYRGPVFQPSFVVLRALFVPLLFVAIPYVAFVDRHMTAPEDGLYHLGRALMFQFDASKSLEIRQHLLGWVVKAFFWPLMFGSLANNMENLMKASLDVSQMTFAQFFQFASLCLFTVDVLVAVVGYVTALRLLDTHIRSTEPTPSGWAICMMCYPPFVAAFMTPYLAFNSQNAIQILADQPTLQMIWGVATLALLLVYVLASVAFGCRFSNITHRGLITGGPYRFTKHPAYVCKTSYWWLLHAPFLPMSGVEDAIRYCLMMAGISAIYFLRARTEERHMSHDPAYVAYASAMNDRSVFAGLARALPFLRYTPPADAASARTPYMGLTTPAAR